MNVTVLLFAGAAERAGTRKLDLPWEHGDTVGRVRDRVVALHPGLAPIVPSLMYAINEDYAQEGEPVMAGATLALIPPVSGG
ncbi:MAG: MoaD/ThiS family protein [Dehalococcoidia bacterium]